MSTSPDVVVVDLGLGNLRSVLRAVERAGGHPALERDPDVVRRAPRLVAPGQGAFRECASALDSGLREALTEAIGAGVPYLGICLGMQMLFERSDEAPGARGLGVLAGGVERLRADLRDPDTGEPLKIPHVGWNEVVAHHALLPERAWFYFVHSYHCVPADPAVVVGTASYGEPICAAVARDNVLACQFHPEKSQDAGHRVLVRFLEARWS